MSTIKLLARTATLLVCSIIQLLAVIFEGVVTLFEKTCEGLDFLRDKMMYWVEKEKTQTEGMPT